MCVRNACVKLQPRSQSACLAIFDCVGRQEYVAPTPQVVDDEPEISEDALQRAQAAAYAEVDAAAEAGSMAEPQDHDVSDAMTVAEPDEEALARDDEMMDERDRQDADVDAYDEGILNNDLRGVLQLRQDSSINTLYARALDALTGHLHKSSGDASHGCHLLRPHIRFLGFL